MKSRIAIAAFCVIVWGGFVLSGKTPVDRFIDLLHEIILGLGLFHAVMTNPTTPTQDAVDKKKEIDLPPKEEP